MRVCDHYQASLGEDEEDEEEEEEAFKGFG